MPSDQEFLTPTKCPACGYSIDATMPLGHQGAPKEDSLTFCARCAAPLLFNADMSLRRLTDEELEDSDQEMKHIIAVVQAQILGK